MKFQKKKMNERKHKGISKDFEQAFFTSNTLRSGKSYLELDTGKLYSVFYIKYGRDVSKLRFGFAKKS